MKLFSFFISFTLLPLWCDAQNLLPPMPRVSNVWLVPNQSAVRFELLDEATSIDKFLVGRMPEFSLAWPAGKLETVNFSAAKAGDVLEKEGRSGQALTQDFVVAIPPEKLTQKQKAWLAVTVWDGGEEALKIDGPALAAPQTFGLAGSGRWVTRTFVVENLAVSEGHNTITFHALKSPSLLGAVSLFLEKNLEATDLVELGSTPARNSVTVLAQKLPWDPKLIRHFLLGGTDKAGHGCVPVAIDPGAAKTSALSHYRLSD